MARGRPSKFTKERKDRIIEAISAGCTYEVASDYAGITRSTLWAWIKKGELGKDKNYQTFLNDIKKAESAGCIALLGTIKQASSKDWKAGAWILERRYGYSRDGVKSSRPEEEAVSIPKNTLEILREQAKELKKALAKAESAESWQAYSALQRQFLSVIQQIRQIEAEEGMADEMDGLSDEQLLAEITGAIISLPPILRQRLEAQINDLRNVVSMGEK